MPKKLLPKPLPIFDELAYELANKHDTPPAAITYHQDYRYAKQFLLAYQGSEATFNVYRRELERLLQWAWGIAGKSVCDLRRADIEAYLAFCEKPPKSWISTQKPPRFLLKNGERLPNPDWRPFVVTVSKAAFRKGVKPAISDYQFSQGAMKSLFAVLGSFYNFLIAEDYTELNPIIQIRQKSRYIRRVQTKPLIRRLSETQWEQVLAVAEQMATANPTLHERTRFMLYALYAMYLRISELAASQRWQPKMADFYQDHEGRWWFVTVGKGNKQRQIAVSDAMLSALKRWRNYLNLSPLPSKADTSPLLPKAKGKGPITSTTYIRECIQACFDQAIQQLKAKGAKEEAETLLDATVHWLRHTGISEDVKIRPREHVRDDAGHSSSAITDKYIDIELKARHASAKEKKVLEKKKK